ncbi:MAG: acetyltransferase [ANME-2 cluster archaeon]|nr:MAG: acetyltransferase [ANME-2 cluster archaeon]
MVQKEKVIIFGTGDFAEVVFSYLENDGNYEVVAFTINEEYIKDDVKFDLPIVPFEQIENEFSPSKHKMFIAVAYSDHNRNRARIYQAAKNKNYILISYIHPKAIVSKDINIGDNCFVFEANVIQPFVKIGNNVIIWSGNHIGHHSKIGNHCFIASHVVISGLVDIGDYCFIGVNATIKEAISIPSSCIIGASALIIKNPVQNGVYGGIPAKLLRVDEEKKG